MLEVNQFLTILIVLPLHPRCFIATLKILQPATYNENQAGPQKYKRLFVSISAKFNWYRNRANELKIDSRFLDVFQK